VKAAITQPHLCKPLKCREPHHLEDVEGVMNADPKEFPDATLLNELSFTEVIEMAYYGAQVIHPKTIKTSAE
jgi:aspartokinase